VEKAEEAKVKVEPLYKDVEWVVLVDSEEAKRPVVGRGSGGGGGGGGGGKEVHGYAHGNTPDGSDPARKPHLHLRGFVARCSRVVEREIRYLRRAMRWDLQAAGHGLSTVPFWDFIHFNAVWLLTWAIVAVLLVKLLPRLRLWRLTSFCSDKCCK
jgi:hypothetical protein